MQGPSIGALATGPSPGGLPGGCLQTEQQPRQNHGQKCRLQAFPEQVCTEMMVITFYHPIEGMHFFLRLRGLTKLSKEEGRLRDQEHLEAEAS